METPGDGISEALSSGKYITFIGKYINLTNRILLQVFKNFDIGEIPRWFFSC